MRIFRHIYLFLILALVSCEKETIIPDTKKDTCNRTVLVYMLASNSLSSYAEPNIDDIAKAVGKGALNDGNLLLYIDKYNAAPVLERLSLKNNIYERAVVKTYDNDSSATRQAMNAVLDDVRTLYPAASYGMILWSHANGWYPSFKSTRSFGDDEGYSLNIDDLAEAIPDDMLDFIICDACYMGCAEIAYELRGKTRYYISSVAPVMGIGFPYKDIVPCLFSCEKSLEEALVDACKAYMSFYRKYSEPFGTISLVDTREFDVLARSVKAILSDAGGVDLDGIQQFSHEKYVTTDYENLFFDLDDYMRAAAGIDTLATLLPDVPFGDDLVDKSSSDSRQLYDAFREALERSVVFADATAEYGCNVNRYFRVYPIDTYCGITAYIPGARSEKNIENYYPRLKWYKDVYQ